MRVLGIESSCDETAAAVVEDGWKIRSSIVASQIPMHQKFGGVVPELASREHLKKIGPVVDEALTQAGVSVEEVDAIAVTEGPGLVGSLLVGLVYGKAMALSLGKPLIGVNHLEGHIHSVLLQNRNDREADPTVPVASFPNITLVVSGGHTCLYRVECSSQDGPLRFHYELLGQTRDDAAGEAFDKVAKLMALGYPGGPVIDRLARYGNPQAVELGRIRMKGNPLDFSFSGLKTAVLYRVRGTALQEEAEKRWASHKGATAKISADEWRECCSPATLDLVASFQEAVVTDLVERTLRAARSGRVNSIFVAGGVASNSALRERFRKSAAGDGFLVFFPSSKLSTDNAAMIAAAAYFRLSAGERAGVSLTAHPSFPLGV